MASSSSVPSLLEMAELRANGFGVPILFPIDADGFAHVSSLHLTIWFTLQVDSIWVEREIYDPLTSLLSLTMRENPILTDNGSSVWKLAAGKYKVYGLPESRPHVSTEIRTPPYSSASTFNTPPAIRVKIEPGIHIVIHISNSSDGDEPVHSTPMVEPSLSPLAPLCDPPIVRLDPMCLFTPFSSKPTLSILHCLRTLASMPDRKNIFKKLDYDNF